MSNSSCYCVAKGQKRGRCRGWRSLPWTPYTVPFIHMIVLQCTHCHISFIAISIHSCSYLLVEDYIKQNGSVDVLVNFFIC